MITLLLLTITAVTVFLYDLFGNKNYRNLIETILSFVACCLLFQYLISTAESLDNHVRVLSVHSSPTTYFYNEDYRTSFESKDNKTWHGKEKLIKKVIKRQPGSSMHMPSSSTQSMI
jgi:hypothetical protein